MCNLRNRPHQRLKPSFKGTECSRSATDWPMRVTSRAGPVARGSNPRETMLAATTGTPELALVSAGVVSSPPNLVDITRASLQPRPPVFHFMPDEDEKVPNRIAAHDDEEQQRH